MALFCHKVATLPQHYTVQEMLGFINVLYVVFTSGFIHVCTTCELQNLIFPQAPLLNHTVVSTFSQSISIIYYVSQCMSQL